MVSRCPVAYQTGTLRLTQISLLKKLISFQGAETQIRHGIDMHEVASESSFKDARKRYFRMCEEDLSFSETILTFNHTPPADEKLIFQLKDKDGTDNKVGTWLTLDGQLRKFPNLARLASTNGSSPATRKFRETHVESQRDRC